MSGSFPWRKPREYTYEYEGVKFRVVLRPITWEEKYTILAGMSVRDPNAVIADPEEARKAAERIATGLSKVIEKVEWSDGERWVELKVAPETFLKTLPDHVVDLIVRDVSNYLAGIDRKNLRRTTS